MNKWYSWLNEVLSGVGLVLGIDLASTKEVLGLVLVVLNILVLIFSLGVKIYSWAIKAKQDGKIDKQELEELNSIVDEAESKADDLIDK